MRRTGAAMRYLSVIYSLLFVSHRAPAGRAGNSPAVPEARADQENGVL
jgi:hypothetical protein